MQATTWMMVTQILNPDTRSLTTTGNKLTTKPTTKLDAYLSFCASLWTAWIIYVNRTSASLTPANSEVTVYVNKFIKCQDMEPLHFHYLILPAWHSGEGLHNDISVSFCQGRIRLSDSFIVGNSTELPTSGLCLQLKCRVVWTKSISIKALPPLCFCFTFLLLCFILLSVRQGVETFNPETFAGRGYCSRKEQNPVNYGMW